MSSEMPVLQTDIAEHIPWIAAVVTGPDQHIDYLNGSFLRMFGHWDVPPDAMGVGRQVRSRGLRARIAQVLETGRPDRIHRCEIPRNYDGNGTARGRRYLDVWLEPIRLNGEPTGAVILYGVDVTHRVHAARTLRRALDHQRKLIESLATTFWGADPLGEDVWEMDARMSLLPRHLKKAAHAARAASSRKPEAPGGTSEWLEALQARTPFAKTRSVVTEDGPRTFITHAVPVLDDDGEIAQWMGVDIDVTAHLQGGGPATGDGAQPVVLETRVRMMRGFSHDVRNALHAADGYAQLLESKLHGTLTDQQLEYLLRMRGIFRNALELLTDMLNVERALTGELEIESKPTDVDSLVADCADGHRAEAELKRLLLQVERSPSPLWTRTDPARVRQILDNLVSNALKYTRTGAVTIRMRSDSARRVRDRRRWITISVSDTGPGVPPTSRDSIFQEFVRIAHDGVEGLGVGLSISRRLARLLGGEITLQSEVGAGSTFTLWLPLDWDESTGGAEQRSP